MSNSRPYDGLTPALVLDALESVGFRCDGRLLALNSYENRVYQVGLDDDTPDFRSSVDAQGFVVAKFYRPDRWSDAAIGEEHAFVNELIEREIPVVPPLPLSSGRHSDAGKTLHEFGGFRFAVYARFGGRAPEFGDSDTLKWMGRFIGRIHSVGMLKPFTARRHLDINTFGEDSRNWLLAHNFIPDDLIDTWKGVADQALDGVRRCYERAGALRVLRIHGDCYGGNVLWTDAGPHFVDFDDSCMGPAVQDLWMLLSGDREAMSKQFADVLSGYRHFCEFDSSELYLIEALRTLRLLHYSAWLARRWDDPAFPMAFPWFNTQRYWQDRILELREQIALMDESPLWLE